MPRIHTVAQDGLITASDKLIGSDGAQNNNFATRNYTVGGISNFVLDGTHAGSFTTITSSGNGTIGADLSVAGNLAVTGNATISGNLTFGDANTDTVAFGADIVSHIIPDVTDTYDLGTSDKIWGNIYVNNITGIGNLQLGDAATDAVSEIKAYGDLELKADSDNDNGYTRGVEIFRTRFDMNGLRIHLNKNLYDENNNLVPDTAFATIEVGDVIYGLGNYGASYATNYSEAITSVDGWYAANDTFVHATDSTGAAYFRLSVASGIAYASNAYLTILPAGQALVSNSNNKSIKFYEGTTSIGTLNASSFVIPGKATIGDFTIPNTLGTTEQVLSVPSSGSELEWKSLNVNGYFFPSAAGTAGQILKIPSSGTRLEWGSSGSGSVAAYKTYTALLNQTGTAAPVATILENTTDGTFTWTRQSGGTYTITASSALFTVNKTIVFGNQGNQTNQYWRWNRTSDTTIDLVTNPSFVGDIGITNGSFEIRIYS